MKKVILLNSGGVDSRVVAAMCHRDGWEIHSLYFDINQDNRERCMKAAQRTADLYCKEHTVVPLSVLDIKTNPFAGGRGVAHSSLLNHMLAAMFSSKWGITYIVSGQKSDVAGTSIGGKGGLSYIYTLQKVFNQNQVIKPPIIMMPFADHEMDYTPVFDIAKELKVPLDDTASCGNVVPCYTRKEETPCYKCKDRKKFNLPNN